ncbi:MULTISPECIES: DMT family transporter [unclassified Phyllobacterium]|uniref:DMT family transporter n=1 Tax=Phyllobacterium TaxID=28100 RepID=UPI00088AB336|nr:MULTISPECIES: DMT family transporter [unclassified Phyllobacterium]MBA8901036.1 drug/metabolite transporter (DMT)-like permease [Phyllobacterium sp. P30BS-XVII]UGX87758.1 DMT family transporter [Phyllobacterium sp. T1293]SDP65151.1 EamA domain-containing membrane protein RarD [Phyllobacterium sp. OV277]
MSQPHLDHRKGLLITGIGGLILSVDIPLLRLGQGETWSTLLLRSGTTFLCAMIIWAVWSIATGKVRTLIPGRIGVAVAGLYGMGSIFFMIAVYNTSTANLVFILAFNTVFAALLSWIFLKERPKTATFVAMFFMLIGVGIIVREGLSSGHLFGNIIALLSTFFLASAITVTRASKKDMSFAAIIGTILPMSVAIFMVSQHGFSVAAPGWIIFNGAVVTTIAFACLATGPRYLSGPEVAMFYLLETVLAPIWVWLVFAERPSDPTLLGGIIIITALVSHSIWQMRSARKRSRMAAIRHPI